MSKPKDIPQDVWNAVLDLPIQGEGFCDYADLEVIARAILTAKAEEREACAAVADDFAIPDQDTEEFYRERFDSSPLDAGVELACECIATLIRKRGEA